MDAYQQTQYKTRQSRYIRVSPHCVLQMILYLDSRHVFWMNDAILERALLVLKDRIADKLRKEVRTKKANIEVYRGVGYQMAYFFRVTAQKHSVLLKSKTVLAPEVIAPAQTVVTEAQSSRPKKRQRMSDQNQGVSRDEPQASSDHADATNEPFDLDVPDEAQTETIVIKDEPQEEEDAAEVLRHARPVVSDPPSQTSNSVDAPITIEDAEDTKPDVKPKLHPIQIRKECNEHCAFCLCCKDRLEPYPALPRNSPALRASQTPAPDYRQLSATPLPPNVRRRSSNSATPFELPSNDRPLFRAPSESPSIATNNEDGEEEGEDATEEGFRYRSQSIANMREAEQEDESGHSLDAEGNDDREEKTSLMSNFRRGGRALAKSDGNLTLDQYLD